MEDGFGVLDKLQKQEKEPMMKQDNGNKATVGKVVAAYDGDPANSNLLRYVGAGSPFVAAQKVQNSRLKDFFLGEMLDGEPDVVFVDLPGGVRGRVPDFADSLAALDTFGYAAVLLHHAGLAGDALRADFDGGHQGLAVPAHAGVAGDDVDVGGRRQFRGKRPAALPASALA